MKLKYESQHTRGVDVLIRFKVVMMNDDVEERLKAGKRPIFKDNTGTYIEVKLKHLKGITLDEVDSTHVVDMVVDFVWYDYNGFVGYYIVARVAKPPATSSPMKPPTPAVKPPTCMMPQLMLVKKGLADCVSDLIMEYAGNGYLKEFNEYPDLRKFIKYSRPDNIIRLSLAGHTLGRIVWGKVEPLSDPHNGVIYMKVPDPDYNKLQKDKINIEYTYRGPNKVFNGSGVIEDVKQTCVKINGYWLKKELLENI
jgi:hypothetical protein